MTLKPFDLEQYKKEPSRLTHVQGWLVMESHYFESNNHIAVVWRP